MQVIKAKRVFKHKKVISARVNRELASILQEKRLEQGLNPILESTLREGTVQQGSFVHKILQAPTPLTVQPMGPCVSPVGQHDRLSRWVQDRQPRSQHCSAIAGDAGRATMGYQSVVLFTTMVHYSMSET